MDAARATVIAEVIIEGKRSVDVFELRDGKVFRQREYLGAEYGPFIASAVEGRSRT